MAMFDDFVGELARGLCRPLGEDVTIAAIVAPLIAKPLAAAHLLAGQRKRSPAAPDVWIRALAGTVIPGRKDADTAIAAAKRLFDSVLTHVQNGTALTAGAVNAVGATFPSGVKFPTPNGFPSPVRPNFSKLEDVAQAIYKFGELGGRELATLPARLAIAQAIEAGALLVPGVRSTKGLGADVHTRIQKSYLSASPLQVVVVDRRVFGPGYPAFVADIAEGLVLADAARVPGPHSICFATMYLAWVTKNWDSRLRADLTDLTLRANWEIKPVLGAVAGVIQEAWYRCSFNWLAGVLANERPELAADLAPLQPGGMPNCSLLRFAPPNSGSAEPSLVVPFTLPVLPGLILYAVVSGPAQIDLAVLALFLLAQIEASIKKSGKPILGGLAAAREAIAAVVGWMLVILVALIAAAVVVIVAVLAFEAVVEVVAVGAAIASAVGPAMAAFIAESIAAIGLATAAAALVFLILDPAAAKAKSEDNVAAQPVALNFGPTAVTMPASAVATFIFKYEEALSDAYASLGEVLGAQAPTA